MATTAITTESENKIWVLACTENEQCEIEALNVDVSFIESELHPPVDPKETNSMYFLKNIPRTFSGDGSDKLWVFIDKKVILRKRPQSGNKKIITSSDGTENFIFPFGEQLAGKKHDDLSIQFQYNYLDYQFDVRTEAVTGDGTAGAANSMGFVSSAVLGTSILVSKDSIRYRPGHSGFADFTLLVDGSGIGIGGAFDQQEQNGFQLKVDNGNASFGYLKSGVEKGSLGINGFDDQSEWNGNLSADKIDFTKMNIFRIVFGFLGVANPTLWIKKDKWYFLQIVKTEGVLEDVHVDTPVFPIGIKAENGATVRTGSWNGGIIGDGSKAGLRPFAFPNQIITSGILPEQAEMTLSGTNVGTIVIFNSKDLFHLKVNNVKARMTGYRFVVDVPAGNNVGEVIFQLVGIQTLSGTASWADINTVSSVMRYDHDAGTGASVDVATASSLITEVVSYSGSNKGGNTGDVTVDAESIGAFAYRNDTFGIVAKDIAGNNVTVRAFLNWEELF